jgi:hypothetical protein
MSQLISAEGRDIRVSGPDREIRAMSMSGDMRRISRYRKRVRLQKMLSGLQFSRCNVVTFIESV